MRGGGTLKFACYISYDYFGGLRILNFTVVAIILGVGHLQVFLGVHFQS